MYIFSAYFLKASALLYNFQPQTYKKHPALPDIISHIFNNLFSCVFAGFKPY